MRQQNRILYYPHYAPKRKKLRTLLLFFDTLELIVPHEDQLGVRRRSHVEETLNLDHTAIRFLDPAIVNASRVLEMSEERVLSKLVEALLLRDDTVTIDPKTREAAGYLTNKNEIDRLFKNNWRAVAVPKIPDRILEIAIDADLGAHLGVYRDPDTDEIKEQRAFLVQETIADYVLSRLARGISEQENISTITFDDFSYLGSLHHENEHYGSVDNFLASLCTPIIIPDRIEDFSPSDFRDLRQAYSDIRAQAWRIFHGFSVDYGLDKAATLEGVASAVDDVTASIKQRMDAAERSIGKKYFRDKLVFCIEGIFTVAGGVIGHQSGTTIGTAGGALFGFLGGKLATQLAPPIPVDPNVYRLAQLRSEINKKGYLKQLRRPAHFK